MGEPITGAVPASELDPKKGLRAKDYLIDPRLEAEHLVNNWLKDTGLDQLLRRRGKSIIELEDRAVIAIKKAYRLGQRAQLELTKSLQAVVNRPSVSRQILPPLQVGQFQCGGCSCISREKHICGDKELCPECAGRYGQETGP